MKYLKIFTDFGESLEMIGDAEAGRLFKAAMNYAKLGEAPELRGNEKFLWVQLKQSIDRSRETYDRKADIARKIGAGNAKGKRNDSERYHSISNDDGRYRNDIVQDKEKDKDKDKDYTTTPLPPPGDGGGGCARYLEDNLRSMTPGNYEELRSYLDDGVSMGLVRYAVDEAAAHGVRTWAYVRRVLNRCLTAGVLTADQARELQELQRDAPAEKPSNRFLS